MAPAAEAPASAPAAPAAPEQPVRAVLPDDFGRPAQPAQMTYTGPAFDSAPGSTGVERSTGPTRDITGQITSGGTQSRNELCACGSGRKYKRCHGDPRNS